ncbi:FHA domain-containing protein [Uliginosibacterium aquaticum]|uniref:FHA domain-containing protein n=1 Tax=Uliginosibacterium aquaticum TaxID=2731212 RepID=A0ABX2IDP2_9RHOO|nr:FHA domain-containing protein [Uliginosibacterium aquaticum]NSL54202.1 FHA domain-containing protein [Uliginosibacterium aquaticum]
MLRIAVQSHDGAPPGRPQCVEFGPEGGSIGREEGNTLLLEDPGKHLSRIQARIKWLGGEYFLVDQGGNPSCINGRKLGKGKVVTLHEGDLIGMGGWALLVEHIGADRQVRQRLVSAPLPPVAAPVVADAEAVSETLEFDFELSTRMSPPAGSPHALLEAFIRGLGMQGLRLPAELDELRAERLGEQLRLLLGEQQAVPAETLHTLLGVALQRQPDEIAAPPGERPC